MPSSWGDSRMTSRRCSLPSNTASRSDCRRSPEGVSSSRCSSAAMTTLLATSPAAWPPMPSATASSRGPAYTESWLLPRIRPRSDRAAYRRTSVMRPPRRRWEGTCPARSRTQLQCGLADADRLAGVDQQRSLDPLLVEVGAVGGAQILHVPLSPTVGQAGVAGAGEVVGQHQRGVIRSADQDRLVAQGDLGAGEGTRGDHEGAGSLLATLAAARGRGPGRDGDHPPGAAAEQVGAHHAERGEDEQPEQQQETEAEDL